MREPVVLESAPNPDAAVILFHGLGADGNDFVPIVKELALPETTRVRFVFPHAPVRPVTINGGMPMPAWFDILGLDRTAAQDEDGIRASAALMEEHVAAQVASGIAPERIFMAGFSQGGAIALFAALRRTEPLAGVIGLSTYLPLLDVIRDEHAGQQGQLPIMMVHGTHDDVLPVQLAEGSRDFIQALGYIVQWQTYPMAHNVCLEEIQLLREFLVRELNPVASA